MGEFDISLDYYQKWYKKLKADGVRSIYGLYRMGYAYWQNGFIEEAKYFLKEQIDYCELMNKLGRSNAELFYTYFDLANTYAIIGDKEKALENLRIFNQKKFIPSYIVFYFNNDPILESLRDEPEFQQIVRDVEAKYQAEHERVTQWLEENEML